MPKNPREPIDRIRRQLAAAQRVAVLTGAGISAESGLPTFRGAGSGWAGFNDPTLASPEGFQADPARVWWWHEGLRTRVAEAAPSAGHEALATLERQLEGRGGRLTLITQNIDGLHQLAGSRSVLELHGTLLRVRCEGCGAQRAHGIEVPACDSPPRCTCGRRLRPAVVWFGEALPADALQAAVDAVSACELFLSVGTSAVVYPAAGLIDLALRVGAMTVEVNPQPTPYTPRMGCALRGSAGEVLSQLVRPA